MLELITWCSKSAEIAKYCIFFILFNVELGTDWSINFARIHC